MLSRIYVIVVALCWTLLLCGLGLAEDYSPLRSFVSYVSFSIPLWAAAWAVGKTSLTGRIVRWLCVFSLVAALHILRDLWGHWHPGLLLFQLPFALLVSAVVVLVVPELKQLRRWATTRRLATDIALAAAFAALTVCGYFLYQRWVSAENLRLGSVVAAEFEKVALPPRSVFVYEEALANRGCKTARMARVFATQSDPAEVCRLIHTSLEARGWTAKASCRVSTYPPNPWRGMRPPFTYARLFVWAPSKFVVELVAEPQGGWGQHSLLSTLGEQDAMPLARKTGNALVIQLRYSEDAARVSRRCPDSARCECDVDTLFAWKFSDGRHLTRSD